ncbi:Uncharacterised protein [uncultured archaeon]|nr:Uncharacterised protein [uncultured archaeon]
MVLCFMISHMDISLDSWYLKLDCKRALYLMCYFDPALYAKPGFGKPLNTGEESVSSFRTGMITPWAHGPAGPNVRCSHVSRSQSTETSAEDLNDI